MSLLPITAFSTRWLAIKQQFIVLHSKVNHFVDKKQIFESESLQIEKITNNKSLPPTGQP